MRTKQEILASQEFLTTKDIADIYKCCPNKALSILHGIKSVSDMANIAGKCTVGDYEAWIDRKDEMIIFSGAVEETVSLLKNFLKIKGQNLTVEKLIRILGG